jgi:hypothetical protein
MFCSPHSMFLLGNGQGKIVQLHLHGLAVTTPCWFEMQPPPPGSLVLTAVPPVAKPKPGLLLEPAPMKAWLPVPPLTTAWPLPAPCTQGGQECSAAQHHGPTVQSSSA